MSEVDKISPLDFDFYLKMRRLVRSMQDEVDEMRIILNLWRERFEPNEDEA
jgi:hypothetical protein